MAKRSYLKADRKVLHTSLFSFFSLLEIICDDCLPIIVDYLVPSFCSLVPSATTFYRFFVDERSVAEDKRKGCLFLNSERAFQIFTTGNFMTLKILSQSLTLFSTWLTILEHDKLVTHGTIRPGGGAIYCWYNERWHTGLEHELTDVCKRHSLWCLPLVFKEDQIYLEAVDVIGVPCLFPFDITLVPLLQRFLTNPSKKRKATP